MAIPEAINKEIFVACPNCGAFNVATRTVGFWHAPKCVSCNVKIDISAIRRSTVTCDNCGNVVLFNGLSSAPQICPNCKNQLISPINRQSYQLVLCPNCGNEVNVKGRQGTTQCPLCQHSFDIALEIEKRKQQESQKPVLIQYGANTQDILWKHPQNSFPKGSRLIVKRGAVAIMLENGRLHMVANEGDYLLEDKALSLSQKLTNVGGGWTYLTDIFFVQTRIAAEFKWGIGYPYEIRDSFGTYTVTANGTLRLRVKDPLALAEHLNFSDLTVSDGAANGAATNGLISDLVVKQVGLCFGEPLQELVTQNHWTLRTLYKTNLQNSILPALDKQLQSFGLELVPNTFFIQALKCDETAQSTQENAPIYAIQNPVLWSAGQQRVHMKDDPAKYADFTVEGSVQPVVTDRDTFLNSSLGKRILAKQYSSLDLRNEISRLLQDLFTQILQPMVNDMDADIRELGLYYSYLKDTATKCLNSAMRNNGLVFENVTFEQKNFAPSNALSGSMRNEGARSFMLDEEKMRRFTQRIKLVETQETGEYNLQKLKIQVEFGEQMSPFQDRSAELDHGTLLRQEKKKIDEMESQTRITSMQYDNDLVILRKKQAKELTEEEHKVNMRDMLHKIDQSDLNWQEKLDEYARIRRNLGFQDSMEHTVQSAHAQYEAQHTMLKYTAEELELLQTNLDKDAQRDERAKQAQFEREMAALREKWEQNVKMCQMEHDLLKFKIERDHLEKMDYIRGLLERARAQAELEFNERIRAETERKDANFVNRSKELMDQIRAFKTELVGYSPEVRAVVEKVIPSDLINSLVSSLQTVFTSVSAAKSAEGGGITTTTTSTTQSNNTTTSNFNPGRIK